MRLAIFDFFEQCKESNVFCTYSELLSKRNCVYSVLGATFTVPMCQMLSHKWPRWSGRKCGLNLFILSRAGKIFSVSQTYQKDWLWNEFVFFLRNGKSPIFHVFLLLVSNEQKRTAPTRWKLSTWRFEMRCYHWQSKSALSSPKDREAEKAPAN